MRQNVTGQVSFTGDKLRGPQSMLKNLFKETIDHIINHLNAIFDHPSVQGTETVLMVGGFSESKMLQDAVRNNFPGVRIVVPEGAGLAVLKGAVIFGHNPSAIIARVAKYTYGIEILKTFNPEIHKQSKMLIIDGIEKCDDVFDKHVEIDQEVHVGFMAPVKSYLPGQKKNTKIRLQIYTTLERNPMYTDGCKLLGTLTTDLSSMRCYEDRGIKAQLIYGNTELGVEATTTKTGEIVRAKFDFLG